MGRTNQKPRGRRIAQGLMAAILAGGLSAFIPGCGVGYVVRSAYFQAELLNSREPIDQLRAEDAFNEVRSARWTVASQSLRRRDRLESDR